MREVAPKRPRGTELGPTRSRELWAYQGKGGSASRTTHDALPPGPRAASSAPSKRALLVAALAEFSKHPVVHYVMKKRAMANAWGPVVDPRLPLSANDEVWAHCERGTTASAIRYETGKQVGDYQIRLIKNNELLFFNPQAKLALRQRGAPQDALQIGPISILEQALALDPTTYQLTQENGSTVATAHLAAEPLPAGGRTVPIRLEEFERTERFVFDAKSGELRSIKVEGLWQGQPITLVVIDEIEHQAYDPKRFELALPRDVSWAEGPRQIKGTALEGKVEASPEGVARAFFNAWIAGQEETLRLYAPYHAAKLTAVRAEGFFPVELAALGTAEAPTDGIYPGVFVPYTVRMNDGSVRQRRVALKRTRDGLTWWVDGGI